MDNRERESHDDKMEKGSFASSDHWKALATSGEESELADASLEKIFESREVPPWQKQLTFRAFFVSFILTILFSFIVMKLMLTTGIIPSLNVAAGLLGFFFVKTWTKFLEKSGLLKQPFTRQENTVIQTCVVASSGIAFSGGFGNYLFGMSEEVAKSSGETYSSLDVKNPSLHWMIGFLFIVSFLGLFSVVSLRKIMIIDFKLIYPSGTATAHLINSFHAPMGAKLAKKQVKQLAKIISFSFLWGFFQWFFMGEDGCGFNNFPTFGLKAHKSKFYFDFSTTYVGMGMICPYLISVSLLLGSLLSWGIMWPLISNQKGHWYDATLPSSSLHGLQGYEVFIPIAMILGDGLYNFIKVMGHMLFDLYTQLSKKGSRAVLPSNGRAASDVSQAQSYDDQRRALLFVKDQIPTWLAITGYLFIAIISIITLPHIFPLLKWYYILDICIFAPVLAFCNAYGCGLTDWSLASTYGKLAIFIISAWAGKSQGGVLASLAACGVMMNIVSTASDLMQDFKTGYMTLTSPRSMFVSQVIGTAMGCIVSPCVFWLFYKAYGTLGHQGSEYPVPYAVIFRSIAILGIEGFSTLPKHCLTFCYVFFFGSMVINGIRDAVGKKWNRFIPIPMAMAIPFYMGGYFAIDMCVGSLILYVWRRMNKANADAYGSTVASGLICGDGIWTLPSSILALAGVKPPICMKFLSRATDARVDAFLQSIKM
ncbi:Probable metal-nicotianamine transporter ysl7 [Ancistrocladus abbreviatus]